MSDGDITSVKYITVEQLRAVLDRLQPDDRLRCAPYSLNLSISNAEEEYIGYIDLLHAYMNRDDVLELFSEREQKEE